MNMVQDLLQDFRHGARRLRRAPGFAAIVVLSLALGIGANVAIFSLVDAALLRPLAVRDPGALVVFSDGTSKGRSSGPAWTRDGRIVVLSHPLFENLRAESGIFAGLAAEDSSDTDARIRWPGETQGASAVEAGDDADGRSVSANYFDVLGVPAQIGRTFLPEDETAPGANPVVVFSHAYWQRRFAGNPALVGARVTLEGQPYTVIGVTRAGFRGTKVGSDTDFWVPLTMQAALRREPPLIGQRDRWWLLLVGRLQPGVSMPTAEARLNETLARLAAQDPALLGQRRPRDQPPRIVLAPGAMGMSSMRPAYRDSLMVLWAGVSLLLLIVCLNVSHLVLARALERRREMNIRMALGATRWRLVRQLLVEAVLLSALGVAAGAALAGWLTDGLLYLAVRESRRAAVDVGFDGRVLAFTALLGAGTAALVGLIPSWQAARAELAGLRAPTDLAGAQGPRTGSRLLLASQLALSLVLLVGAGLLAASLGRLRTVDKGFDEDHVTLASIKTGMKLTEAQQALLNDEVLRRVAALPGVASASLASKEILGLSRVAQNVVVPGTESAGRPNVFTVTPRYFQTVGMTLVRGRTFTGDDRAGAPRVAVINEALARRLFGTADDAGGSAAIGQRFRFDPVRAPEMPRDDVWVVGVVKDARIDNVRWGAPPALYLPAQQSPGLLESVQIRAGSDPTALTAQLRGAIEGAGSGVTLASVRTMRGQVDEALRRERLLATLSTVFGLAALLLVSIGLYGVISQWAGQRTREIGLRMALGATTAGVRWLVLRQALVLVLAGLAVGLPASVAASRLMQAALFGISPTEPAILTLAMLLMLTVATLAAYLPASRAAAVDPMVALRND
jgi:predicted permease